MPLEQELAKLRSSAGLPAVVAVRVSSSGIEDIAATGVRRLDRPDPVTLEDRFHLGSNAKAMTAILAAQAVERGLLAWDTPAATVLGRGEPTLHQLLAHAAGLAPYGEDEEVAAVHLPEGTPVEERAAFARHVLEEPPRFAPGTEHAYSNAGPVVATAMVESLTGVPWEEALTEHVFEALGIDGRVGWPVLHDEAAPLGHRLDGEGLAPHDPAIDPYALTPALRPAGDVSMSIGDYGAFLVDELAGLRGAGRLLQPETYRALHTPDPADEPDGVGFALGWGVRNGPHGPVSQHTGSADTFYAVVVLEPERDRGLAVVTNAYSDAHERAVNELVKAFLRQP